MIHTDLFYRLLEVYRIELKEHLKELDRIPSLSELEAILKEIRRDASTGYRDIARILKVIPSGDIEEVFGKVEREVKCAVITTNKPGTVIRGVKEKSWITDSRISGEQWSYWNRYILYLRKKGWSDQVIQELTNSTLTIAELLGDPLSNRSTFKRGVVIGNVQSGKTTNFNGVINRAIDLGYKLIIVFSGIMDDLRAQTQDRIEQDVIGYGRVHSDNENGYKGVGKLRPFGGNSGVFQIESPTTVDKDFKSTDKHNANYGFANPKILVCKKNHSVLANLIHWVSTSIPQGQSQMDIPLLVLDDEADNASLNNLGYQGRQYASKVNGHIRALLELFSRKSYLGYTATPFANILQDQNEGAPDSWTIKYKTRQGEIVDKCFSLTDSLFPDDFMYKLNPPSNYIGPKLVFNHGREKEGERKFPIISIIDDYGPYYPGNARKGGTKPDGLPESLRDAVDCFILSVALRLSRESVLIGTPGYNPHHTMLVHVSRLTDWQNDTADKLAGYLEEVITQIKGSKKTDPKGIYAHFEKQWDQYYAYEVRNFKYYLPKDYFDSTLEPRSFDDIRTYLPSALKGMEVKAINSERKQSLNYVTNSKGEGQKVIAVGGNRLSRGFTLEGLTVSYFIRDTNYSDTLLQMGRWFGYRTGYADACKVFMDLDTYDKFNFITSTVRELEELIEDMNRANRRPADFAMRIRNDHDTLRLTRPSILKGKHLQEVKFTFKEKLVETYKFELNPERIRKSWEKFDALVADFNSAGKLTKDKSFFKIETDRDGLFKFLDSESSFISTNHFTIDGIKAYVDLAVQHGYLTNWTIAILKGGSKKKLTRSVVLKDLNMTIRSGPKKPGPVIISTDIPETEKSPVNYYNLLEKHNLFHSGGRSARIVSSGKEESINLHKSIITAAEEEFRNQKILNGEISEADKVNFPGKIYRMKREPQEGLLLVYLLDTGEIIKNMSDSFKSRFDPEIPVIGYAFSFPSNVNDPGGIYIGYEIEPDEHPVETDDLEMIEDGSKEFIEL